MAAEPNDFKESQLQAIGKLIHWRRTNTFSASFLTPRQFPGAGQINNNNARLYAPVGQALIEAKQSPNPFSHIENLMTWRVQTHPSSPPQPSPPPRFSP